MADGHGQFDVAHALAAYAGESHFNTATVTHDPFVTDAFVFTAVALIILYRTENTLAEQPISFRFVGTVVDGLRLQHLTA